MPLPEMGEGWEKSRSFEGEVVGKKIAGGNKIFCFRHVKCLIRYLDMLIRYLIICAVF